MLSAKIKYQTIDEYIRTFPKDVQNSLEKIRQGIKKAAPKAEEAISYQIPTFKLHGNLVHFAAFKNHISFFPTSNAIRVFSKELSSYETSKGTIKFPLDKRIPLGLITKITKFRLKEDLEKQKRKSKK